MNSNWEQNAYYLNFKIDKKMLVSNLASSSSTLNTKDKLSLYHKRLNHLNKDYIIRTIKEHTLNSYNSDKETLLNNSDCEACYIGKFYEIVSYKPLSSPSTILIYFDIDICRPFKTKGINNESYFITYICRKSRAVWVYSLKYKSEAIDSLIKFYSLIKNQFNISTKNLRLDNAKEFKSSKWDNFTKAKGIICEYTSPYTPAQNRIVEALNKYIIVRLITICKEKNISLTL